MKAFVSFSLALLTFASMSGVYSVPVDNNPYANLLARQNGQTCTPGKEATDTANDVTTDLQPINGTLTKRDPPQGVSISSK